MVHESLYVYAADKINGGMALAEKWQLILEQPAGSSNQQKESRERRTSIVIEPIPDTSPRTSDHADEAEK